MADSPNARHRSRLIREMSRDLNKTTRSCASSTGSQHGTVGNSTVSDFDPENEAIMSTRQMDLDFSQRLPELRDTAKKYGRWNGGRQSEFVINTSAIGRAFPDFSQGGSSDDSMSIEIGRGPKTRQRTPSRTARAEYSDNIDSPVVTIGSFQILGTPPMKGLAKQPKAVDTLRSAAKKEGKRISSQKENIPPPNSAQYISGASRTASGEQRRSFADLHARVTDESEGSLISDERPASAAFPARSSRFSSGQIRNSPLSAVQSAQKQKADDALIASLSGRRASSHTPTRPQAHATTGTATPNPTGQSFLLPNMPEISELVSGTFRDGTPVFSSSGKGKSRFVSTSDRAGAGKAYNQVNHIPVPDEEKAIFISLELLQEKVATLEMEKADAQRRANDYQQEIYLLQAEKVQLEKHRRSDSGLGMADSGGEAENRDLNKALNERSKLEAQVKGLQSVIDNSERKMANQDLRLKTISSERDQAVEQLAEAYYNSQQLKSENAELKLEIDSLKMQLSQLTTKKDEDTRDWQENQAALMRKMQRQEKAAAQIREITREIQETRTFELGSRRSAGKSTALGSSRHNQGKSSKGQASRGRNIEDSEAIRRRVSSNRQRSRSQSQQRNSHSTQGQSRAIGDDDIVIAINDSLTEDYSFDEGTRTIHKDLNIKPDDSADAEADHTEDSNYSSILGHGEMDRMRDMLAEEKVRLQQRMEAADAGNPQENATNYSELSVRSSNQTHNKAQSKTLPGILKNKAGQSRADATERSKPTSNRNGSKEARIEMSHHRRHSDNSIRINPQPAEEMTSAFILPDITLHTTKGVNHPVLSQEARRVLDHLVQHDGHNCTVCSRVASFDNHGESITMDMKETVRIEKPIPVSDRMPTAGPYEEEPTMRPAVAPGLALATVLKGLNDELAHLKMECEKYSQMYNKHDPSLGMRKRKAISLKLGLLRKACDRKADQIYALNDVLEGQKQSGQEMSERDVEITLQSIGVSLDIISAPRGAEASRRDEDEESDAESELDLPWEGIEDTTGSTEMKGRRRSWHA